MPASFSPTVESPARWWLAGALLLFCGYWGWNWWRQPPAVEFDNLKYIQLLRTAVSAERTDWLMSVTQALAQRQSTGQISAQELRHFQHIISLAESGQWQDAHERCFAFEEAQLNRRRALPTTSAHEHQH